MNSPQDFCYWLQGFVELQDSDSISDKQWLVIKDHLKLVFDKKTPDRFELNPSFTSPKLGDFISERSTWPYMNTPYTVTC